MLAKKTLVYAIASDSSTRSVDSTSSGCCSSKGSLSKSSSKSKSSKKSKKTTCAACKKDPPHKEPPSKEPPYRIDQDKTASQKSVVVQDPSKNMNSSSLFDGKFICNKDYVFPGGEKKVKDFRTSRISIPPVVQPVIGVCTDGRCGTVAGSTGEKLLHVRYSIVRISTFSDYTTYEILKSSTKKPKKLPAVVEGIFVTKR